MNTESSNKVDQVTTKSCAYNDSRFHSIYDRTQEIKALISELNEMSHNKFRELLGDNRQPEEDTKPPTPNCWADEILLEQDATIKIIKDTIERISIV